MDLADDETIEDLVTKSQQLEEEIFLNQIREFYDTELERHKELYDFVADQTNNFRDFDAEIIRKEPRVVKILRYLVKPPISQMKFGQFNGVGSTTNYEGEDPSTPNKDIAQQMADFMQTNMDERKVPWIYRDVDVDDWIDYSRDWTCDIIAQSEAKTRYRNWRKDIQEEKVAEAMKEAGLQRVSRSSTISDIDDIPASSFVSETKVAGPGDDQKADFVARPAKEEMLFLEAKAIGVKIDSYKRIKEIRNKESDWRSGFPNARVGAALAGWIPASQIETLRGDDIEVFWEHRLGSLQNYLQSFQ
ncbi:XamI family restriction endonuclease [Halodesulfurarchaeum sp. HSR-GB]|uniref:XamI family restriction endonuclease n=1 Tax=Halodesulfurarchaeum sp. HSR-GB TaxID=3074077 RepID=UPI0028620572|nr:XamI family restriction endonuclease [Halodesulfurarchaeum sp. HSR-GB]MDR5657737.1 XamI family restriction endonuclease [Halodesulfurarchaeum sp. HSR-GB]